MANIDRVQLQQLSETKSKEQVNHPDHYNQGQIEVIDYIEDLGMGDDFCAGNAIKYISRYKYKGKPLEDLKKAKWYIERLIERYEKNK
jgi:hypothetical protein